MPKRLHSNSSTPSTMQTGDEAYPSRAYEKSTWEKLQGNLEDAGRNPDRAELEERVLVE
jgi:hypothetical protein